MPTPKLLVIGLDCAPPKFLFDTENFPLPHIHALMQRGSHGVLESCDPPITVPAWSCMTTGTDPGALGCYGFRNRADRSYGPMRVATSLDVHPPRVWDFLGGVGYQSIVLGVPQTYPPRPVHGHLVSGLLTPDTDADYTSPACLNDELRDACGEYVIDVPDFRTDARDRVLADLYALLSNRFRIAEHLMTTKSWDFMMLVDIGLDRLHHAFWRYADPAHPGHEPGHRYAEAFRDYYRRLDAAIGRLLDLAPEGTGVLVVSDHGAKPIFGAVRINQWLIDHGYLALKGPADTPRALDWNEIDWTRTTAFSTGGYYARIFLNVAGREPDGIVPESEADALRRRLGEEIRTIPLPSHEELANTVLYPEELYSELNGIPPDLLVYFGNLHYRAAGTVGADSIYADENDTGPDDANHAKEGVYVFHDPAAGRSESRTASIYDIAPTILDWFDLPRQSTMRGRALMRARQ